MTTLVQHTNLIKQANKITNRKTLYAAGAGLIPFPIVDTATLLGVQLTMIRSIGNLYDIPFKKHLAKSLVGALISSIGSVSLIKVIPGIGTVIGGTTAAVAGAASTYALGKVFTQHFDQGGTLLDFDPISSRKYFQEEYEAGRLFVTQEEKELATPVALKSTTVATTTVGEEGNRTTKALLLKETGELQQKLVQLQESIDKLQKTPNKKKKVKSSSKTNIPSVADFTIIEGIGPKIEAVLKNAGIYSMENLSTTSEERLKHILKEAGGNFNFADPGTWAAQASLAAAGKIEELEALKKELIGGKVKGKK